MEKLKECPVCHKPVHEIEENEFGCDQCKRVWLPHDGMWVSKARTVRLTREPKVGDSPDDFLEPI